MINISPKNCEIPDLDGYLAGQILGNLKKDADFTTFDKMKQQVKIQDEINKLNYSDF